MIYRNLRNRSVYGLVIDWRFHKKNRWVSTFTPYLIKEFIESFHPIILTSQFEYDLFKGRLKFILSMEPGWAAPKIIYDSRCDHVIAVMASDPHNKTSWFSRYVFENGIAYVLSQYHNPFFFHFPDFPEDRFIHFPWAVPDQFLSTDELTVKSDRVVIFGAMAGEAYDVRNWCRSHTFVENYGFSGVENKELSDEDYFAWIKVCDAIIAAGSSKKAYDLVTPKYFEIAAGGALLIGQRCNDLPLLGFNDDNMLVFTRDDFVENIQNYKRNPNGYLAKRSRGRQLVSERHLVSHRIAQLSLLFR